MADKETAARQKRERIRRWRAGEIEPEHGTSSTYSNYDCRCDECVADASRRWQQYMADKAQRQALMTKRGIKV